MSPNVAKYCKSRDFAGPLLLALLLALLLTLLATGTSIATSPQPYPNILLILADDLGYGDVTCYNADAKVSTPNIDSLAKQGMRFTDAHSASTVCTPSRYGILTGRMAFRTGFRGVFTGVGGPCLIEERRLTLPAMLQQRGYTTALFGKWHIGMTFVDHAGQPIRGGGLDAVKQIDYSRSIPDGPLHRGFDHFFGTVCCPTTDWLYAYIDGDHIPIPPTQQLDPQGLPQHEYSHDNRRGMIAPDYDLEKVDLMFLEKSCAFIRKHVTEQPERPFFLFHSMQAVHLPSFAADRFKGATNAGPHGDFIHEMDWIVGQLLGTLTEQGIADNTIVIFTSDNGPEAPSVISMRRDYQHDGARPWRGVKRDQWEGGHRVPFIVRWPRKVVAGSVSAQLVSLTDLLATCAAIVGFDLPNESAEDSYNMLPALLGEDSSPSIRPHMLEQTWTLQLSIRRGTWKYLDHQGSGGNDYTRDGRWGMKPYALPDLDPTAPGQLYDLAADPGETTNLYNARPDVVADLKRSLRECVDTGRSAPVR
ncbi:MAG: sulfatase-like hydrolase/transferase [Pirellulaceae bacterium]